MHLETIEGRAKKEALELEIVKEVCSEIIEFIFIYILFCYSLKHYQRYNPCYKIDFYLSSFVPFFTVGNQWQSGWKFYIDWRQTGLQNIEAFELDPFHLGSHHSSCRFSAWSVENCRDIGCRVLGDSCSAAWNQKTAVPQGNCFYSRLDPSNCFCIPCQIGPFQIKYQKFVISIFGRGWGRVVWYKDGNFHLFLKPS